MHRSGQFLYYESKSLDSKFLEVPFQGEDASMTIILPNKMRGLPPLENQIEKALRPCNITFEYVNVALPIFQSETTIDVKTLLKEMGASEAFQKDTADFSRLAGNKGDVIIDKILQTSFVSVS